MSIDRGSHTAIANIALPLFVPADRRERLNKAVAAKPDVVIIDLEDAVAPDNKAPSRDALAEVLQGLVSDIPLILRVNAKNTPWHLHDLVAATSLPLVAIMLPKAESGADVARVSGETGLPVIALIETARGMVNINDVAESAARLAFGSIDYAADLSIDHTRQALGFARSQMVLASRYAQLPSPIDGVTTSVHDSTTLADDCAHAREMGFGGKLLIHPAQIAPARAAFLPSVDELAWANRVIDAASGNAVILLDGAMVDAPVIMRAHQILTRAAHI